MKLQKIKASNLKFDGENPNELSESMKKRLKGSIQEFGYVTPIVVDEKTLTVADGQHRAEQLIADGHTEIEVVMVKFKDDTHRRTFRQAANKIRGTHLPERDAAELLKIIEGGHKDLLKMVTGLSVSEVQSHLRRHKLLNKEEDEDAVPENIEEVQTNIKAGDIFKLGNHRLMCGDSTKSQDVGLLMLDEKADMAFTDPPYGVSYADKNKFLNSMDKGNRLQSEIQEDHGNLEQISELWFNAFKIIKNNLKDQSCYYITGPQGGDLHLMMMMMKKAELPLRHCLVWVKNNHVLGRTDYNYKHEPLLYGWDKKHKFYGEGEQNKSVWLFDKPTVSDLHPTMKPIPLIVNAIQNSSKEEHIILDLFGGSGSTLIACEKTQRHCRMMEISPQYCEVIIRRFIKFVDSQEIVWQIQPDGKKVTYLGTKE